MLNCHLHQRLVATSHEGTLAKAFLSDPGQLDVDFLHS